ncbi:MAG TPA: FAD-binding protein [Jiangellales bacterium]|nr:FAD-binding protein [Jiangellales bacterium]
MPGIAIPPSPAPPATARALVAELRRACGGAVNAPGDPCYDLARQAWQADVDQRPLAVVHPADAAEVAAVVRAAAASGATVAPQGTGHRARPLGDLSGAVLLRTGAMRRVDVDPAAQVARAEAGALWVDVVDAVAPYGLAALHGWSPDVGVTGYSLGGGIGPYARALGLQAGHLTAVELVLADGQVVRATAEEEAELFWALRGGGGSFGVVTALEMRLHPVRSAYAGCLAWDWRETRRVLARWADWAATAPPEVTTSFSVRQAPDTDGVPVWLRGRRVAALAGAVLGDDATAERILAPLRELGPELDAFTRRPARDLAWLHGDPGEPRPLIRSTAQLGSLPPAAVDAVVDVAGPDPGSRLLTVELRQLGGALGRPHRDGGALTHLPGQFTLHAVGSPPDPDSAAALAARAGQVAAALRPWSTGRLYAGLTDAPTDPARFHPPDVLARLRAVRAAVDPQGVIRTNHPL